MNRKIAHLNFTWKTTRSEFIACDLKELNPFAHLLKPLNDARGDGGVVSERKVKIQIVWLSNCSVNARPIVALMFLFSIVSYLSISTITLWLVYYLKQHFTKWQVFVRFSSNFNLIDRLSKSYSKAIWWNFEKLSMVSSFSVWIL